MNQLTNVHQENNDLLTPESLEGRANQILDKYLTLYDINDISSIKFSQEFPLSDEEAKIALPWMINKIFEKEFTERKEVSPGEVTYAIACHIYSLLEIYKTQGSIDILCSGELCITDEYAKEMVLWGVFCLTLLDHTKDHEQLEYIFHNLVRRYGFNKNMLGGIIGKYFCDLSSWDRFKKDPAYWIERFDQIEEEYMRDIFTATPFLWTEKEFTKYTKPSSLPNHVSITGRNYRIHDTIRKYAKTSKKFSQSGSFHNWCVHLFENSRGKLEFQIVPTVTGNAFGAFYAASIPMPPFRDHIPLGSWKNLESGIEETCYFVKPDPTLSLTIDNSIITKTLEDIRSFDAQKSLSKKAQPIVENVSQDVTTLTHHAFTNPKQHHTDVAQSLGLDIVDHTDDIGAAEGAMMLQPRYKNSHGTSNLHYLPKIAWLIDLLEDIIPKNEHGKITAYTLPSSPYVFIYTNTGTIFVSDIDNVSTQVFAQKVDPEFINSDFSFPALGALFGPFTSIKNTFEEVISDESAEGWAQHILHALSKKEAHFPDLMSNEPCNWGTNLRALYRAGEITKKDFATPADLKQFLENYNRKISLRNDITIQEKRTLSFVNSRGGVPTLQPIINDLGGHAFFTSYHGHVKILSDYMDAVLSDKREQYGALYENLRSKNIVKAPIRGWINELKNGANTLSDVQFQGLFSPDTHTKKSMRKELNVPFGLFTSVSWIIALGYDPEGVSEGETMEMYLYRILIEEKILSHNQNT